MPPPTSTVLCDSHQTHPIRPLDGIPDDARSFIDPTLAPTHIYRSTPTPKYIHHQLNLLRHSDTIRLQTPASHIAPTTLYLNDKVINRTLEILYHHSPYADTRHFLPSTFLENISRPDNDTAIPRYHRRAFTLQDGPSFTSEFLLVPLHITPTHWTLLVRHNVEDKRPHTVSHDSLSMPLDFTDTVTHLTYHDRLLKLTNGFTTVPIRHIPAVIQDDKFNCGIFMLTTAIIYLYHPHPMHFPWHTMNQPYASLHMRQVIISILASGKPPILVDILPPRSPDSHSNPPEPNTRVTHKTPHNLQPPIVTIPTLDPQTDTTVIPHFTKIAAWNIDRQASYDGPISACIHGDLDHLHCPEPTTHMTPGTRATSTLITTADKAGYTLFVTHHSHI